MTWTTTLITIYLGTGWLVSFLVIFFVCDWEEGTVAERRLIEAVKRRPVLDWICRTLAAIAIGPITPMLLVYGCVQVCSERKSRRTHCPTVSEPKAVDELPQ